MHCRTACSLGVSINLYQKRKRSIKSVQNCQTCIYLCTKHTHKQSHPPMSRQEHTDKSILQNISHYNVMSTSTFKRISTEGLSKSQIIKSTLISLPWMYERDLLYHLVCSTINLRGVHQDLVIPNNQLQLNHLYTLNSSSSIF